MTEAPEERRFGLTEINTDVDSQDWNNATVDQIVERAALMKDGDVILMHDWPPNTVAAIPRIAAGLRARNLCAGKISEVTGMEGQMITMQDLFKFEHRGLDGDGRVLGRMTTTGIKPTFVEMLDLAGIQLPESMFLTTRWD